MFDREYNRWNQTRIKNIVSSYGHKFFHKKKILDLGCGHGHISGALYRLGADVTAVDVRQEHLQTVSKKFVGIKTVKADLDNEWPFNDEKFDIILDLGLMCHLRDYEQHLKKVCAATTHLVLETTVCDSDDEYQCAAIDENKDVYDLSFNGKGCRPSVAAIERVLVECGMSFKRLDKEELDTDVYKYSWRPADDNSINFNKRRMWIAFKNENIQSKKSNTMSLPTIMPNKPITRPISTSNKIRLFFNYYEDKNPIRKQELLTCLNKNITNPYFDIIVLDSPERPTYDFFFQKINRLAAPNDISIFCHSDIFFDKTIELASKIEDKEIYMLTKWNWPTYDIIENGESSTWIVKGKIENVYSDFPIGINKSSQRFAYELNKAGYKLSNPAKKIKTFHIHNSNIKNYTDNDIVLGPYLTVPIIG
jgi:2-polyprenyl-3-methyl-5-hydroxy-6-metoxy-1,4-benzoquinol methylase